MTLPAPFDVAPTLVDPTGKLSVWLTDPPGMVDRLETGAVFTADVARFLVGPATDAMLALKGDRYHFIHDWRGVASYESDARIKIINWGRALGRKRIERIGILLSDDASTMFRMAVHAGTAAMTVLGITCNLEPTFEAAMSRASLHPRHNPRA